MWWAALIELGLFFLLMGIVAWVFFKPRKKDDNNNPKP